MQVFADPFCAARTEGLFQLYDHDLDRGETLTLIEAPGFETYDLSDEEFLAGLVTFMRSAPHLHIIAAVYCHSMKMRRIHNDHVKSLNMFRAICDKSFFRNVVCVTTMWDHTTDHK